MLEFAQAIGPLLATGADKAVEEMARQAGAGAAATVRRLADQLRRGGGDDPDLEQTAAAVRAAVAEGLVTEPELSEAALIVKSSQLVQGTQVGGNAYVNSTIRVEGGGSFHG
jgi:hypothetical protein